VKADRKLLYLLIAGAGIVWIVNAYTIATLIAAPHVAVKTLRQKNSDTLARVTNLADSALKCMSRFSPFYYTGNFESPFRLFSEAFAPPVLTKNASTPRITLVLKGVLLKEQPLAILEDETGKTSICGIGETIRENVIESIEPNRVKLRGSRGTYMLSVKE
jgi:type II secretory pathway component PulC